MVQEVLQRRQAPGSRGVQWLAIGSWQQPTRGSWRLILWQLHENLPRKSTLTILRSFSIWSKLGRCKSALSRCLTSWPKIKKKSSFWNVIFYSMQQQQTVSLLDCEVWQKVDFIQQLVLTGLVIGLRRSAKALPKPKLHQKKVIVTVGGCTINASKVECIGLWSFSSATIFTRCCYSVVSDSWTAEL